MIGRPLVRLESVGSTQDITFELAERGAAEGTTVLARYQQTGRGRAGRKWESVPGDALMFSIVLRPSFSINRLGLLSLLAGDAIAGALNELYTFTPAVKWPNDVLVDGEKVSGVLTQTRIRGTAPVIAVLGIGINVNSDQKNLPSGASSVRSILGHHVDPEPLFRTVLTGLEQRYRNLQVGDVSGWLERIDQHLWLKGEDVTLHDAERLRSGRLLGVDDTGALHLQTEEGPVRIVSGELVRGPRKGAS